MKDCLTTNTNTTNNKLYAASQAALLCREKIQEYVAEEIEQMSVPESVNDIVDDLDYGRKSPFKMPFEMRNMTTFPIECLCLDLKLEVLEQLDAGDVMELGKVNQGFQRMISSRPSIVFGHHVDGIELYVERINIKRLNEWNSGLDVIRHLPFIKNIRSCNQLWIKNDYGPIDKDPAAFLKQLEAVNSLDLFDCAPQHLELLSHLSIKIKEYADLPSFLQEAPSIKGLFGHFIEARLNECETVWVHCSNDDEFQFYYNTFVKTHINYVGMRCISFNADIMLPAIQTIVSHGIPSKNPAAVVRIFFNYDDFEEHRKATVVVFLKGYPGMKQIYGKNRQPFIALANDRDKGSIYDQSFAMKALCFRQNITATRDCIYVLSFDQFRAEGTQILNFFAFYLKPDEMIDH